MIAVHRFPKGFEPVDTVKNLRWIRDLVPTVVFESNGDFIKLGSWMRR